MGLGENMALPEIPSKIIVVRAVHNVASRSDNVLLDCEIGDEVYQEVEFKLSELKAIYEYIMGIQ